MRDIPFVARHASRTREEVCKTLKIPGDKPIVLASFGGYGLTALDTDALSKFKKYTVITTVTRVADARTTGCAGNGEEGLGHQHQRRVDVCGRRPLRGSRRRRRSRRHQARLRHRVGVHRQRRGHPLHLTRPLPRHDVIVEEMPKFMRSAFINHDDLFAQVGITPGQAAGAGEAEEEAGDQRRRVAADILLKALDKPPKKPRGRPKAKF